MLRQFDNHISAAKEHAQECKERAMATTDQALRADLAELEKGWLDLVNSFEKLKSWEDVLRARSRRKGIIL
jgi:hypothetical protein